MRPQLRLLVALVAMFSVSVVAQAAAAVPSDDFGLVDPSSGVWHLYEGEVEAIRFYYGNPGDYPFMGDWDCDGVDTPGLYRQFDGYVYLRNANSQGSADVSFFFGDPGDIPIAGDFNNDGCDTVSIYRPSEQRFHIINELGTSDGGLGAAEYSFLFGNAGDKPFVGDFNGNGQDTVGLHRESTGLVYYRNTNTTGNADNQFIFGDPDDTFVAGDWSADGEDSPGVFRPSGPSMHLRYKNSQGNADKSWNVGQASWLPVAGMFSDMETTTVGLARPLGGEPLADWVIVNYFDRDPARASLLDYAGGAWTYDGHDAIDFTLRSFALMDQGIDVLAAADGVVESARDGSFDRNTCGITDGVCTGTSNLVRIAHANGLISEYNHLRKNSVLVAEGESVTQGQKIAEVGSSGNSSDAHLHFGVYDTSTGKRIDPFAPSLWLPEAELPYAATMLSMLDGDTSDHLPTRVEFTERPPRVDSFVGPFTSEDRVAFWAHVSGAVSPQNTLTVRLYRPNGTQQWSSTYPYGTLLRYSFPTWWFYLDFLLDIEPGTWRWAMEQNGAEVMSRPFSVLSESPAVTNELLEPNDKIASEAHG